MSETRDRAGAEDAVHEKRELPNLESALSDASQASRPRLRCPRPSSHLFYRLFFPNFHHMALVRQSLVSRPDQPFAALQVSIESYATQSPTLMLWPLAFSSQSCYGITISALPLTLAAFQRAGYGDHTLTRCFGT